jgi:hypothetical protein
VRSTLGQFQELRSYLSHSLLRNGILARLGVTSEFSSCAQAEARLQLIERALLSIDRVTENHRWAIREWEGRDVEEPGFRARIAQLVKMANAMQTCKPSSRFPSDQEINGWLDGMGQIIEQLRDFTRLTAEERAIRATKFAKSVVSLADFLRDIDVDSGKFWDYFDPVRKL